MDGVRVGELLHGEEHRRRDGRERDDRRERLWPRCAAGEPEREADEEDRRQRDEIALGEAAHVSGGEHANLDD